jgi:hypothetical protein
VQFARVYVQSLPTGAQIEVDGQTLGTTPAEVPIAMNKKVLVSIKREGYLPYVKEYFAQKSPEEFSATLQKARLGYVDIDITAGDADIYVNDQKLAERPPIRRYPVPADTKLEIKAINSLTNTSDQISVVVKQDTVQKVRLYPRKTK